MKYRTICNGEWVGSIFKHNDPELVPALIKSIMAKRPGEYQIQTQADDANVWDAWVDAYTLVIKKGV